MTATDLDQPALTFESSGPAETRRIGERLARLFEPGDVVLLRGELGAGKTCLAQGIGRGLRVAEAVKSSSFVLVNEYAGRLRVYHADLFRLNAPEEVADLALEENAREGLLLVEWPERALEVLPPEHLLVEIEIVDDRRRRLRLTARGGRYESLLHRFGAATAKRGGAV